MYSWDIMLYSKTKQLLAGDLGNLWCVGQLILWRNLTIFFINYKEVPGHLPYIKRYTEKAERHWTACDGNKLSRLHFILSNANGISYCYTLISFSLYNIYSKKKNAIKLNFRSGRPYFEQWCPADITSKSIRSKSISSKVLLIMDDISRCDGIKSIHTQFNSSQFWPVFFILVSVFS